MESRNVIGGRLLAPLYITAGAVGFITAFGYIEGGSPVVVFTSTLAVIVGVVALVLPWERVPDWVLSAAPYLALGNIVLAQEVGGTPDFMAYLYLAMTFVWAGACLPRNEVVGLLVIAFPVVVLPVVEPDGVTRAVMVGLMVVPLLGAIGFVLHWFQARIDAATEAMLASQQASAEEVLAAQRQAEAEARARAREAADALARQEAIRARFAERAVELTGSTHSISEQTAIISSSSEEMSTVFTQLYRTAEETSSIMGSVADKAGAASDLMRELAAAGDDIVAAADTIQRLSAQTNLLALNATIESARAGEAGRGFAVVADEVKTLARQSGQSADSISRTLDEVKAKIAAAAEGAVAIRAEVDDLSGHHERLVAAMHEQHVALREISDSVGTTARGANHIAAQVDELDLMVRESVGSATAP